MDGRPRAGQSNLEVTNDLRIGVIGLGFGANHARILREMPGACLAAVADANPERFAPFEVPGTHAYAGHAAMLASERLDAVIVAVPASLHAEVALAAIAAGCAVLVEKPLAPSLAEAQRIVEAARASGVALMPGHIERFNPAVIELARRVHAGEIGRVLQVTARRMSANREREHGSRLPPNDVNVIHDSAIHDIDAIRHVLGLEVASVYGVAQSGIVTPAEDAITATLRFASPHAAKTHAPAEAHHADEAHASGEAHPFRGGASTLAPIASLDVNWLSPRRVRDLSVLGEHGMFIVNYAAQSLSLHRTAGEPAIEIPIAHHDQLEAELSAFVAAVRDSAPMPVTAEDGLAAVAIADALTRSARTGKPVTLGEGTP